MSRSSDCMVREGCLSLHQLRLLLKGRCRMTSHITADRVSFLVLNGPNADALIIRGLRDGREQSIELALFVDGKMIEKKRFPFLPTGADCENFSADNPEERNSWRVSGRLWMKIYGSWPIRFKYDSNKRRGCFVRVHLDPKDKESNTQQFLLQFKAA